MDDKELDDKELAALLTKHAQVERPLRADERDRIQARLAASTARDASATSDELVDGPVDISRFNEGRPTRQQRSRRIAPIAAIAASLLVIAGLVALFAGPVRDSGDVAVVAEPDVTPLPTAAAPVPTVSPPPPTCPATVNDFIAGVDAWDGIDQWAVLVDERRPDPDLNRLADAALADWRFAAPTDALHDGLDLAIEDGVLTPAGSNAELAATLAGPVGEFFDAIRVAAASPGNIMQPCGDQIELTVSELGLEPLDSSGE